MNKQEYLCIKKFSGHAYEYDHITGDYRCRRCGRHDSR
jgi:hypothetical protein